MAPDATSWADLREVLAHLGGLQAAQDVQALTNAVYSMPLAMLVDVVMFNCMALPDGNQAAQSRSTATRPPVKVKKRKPAMTRAQRELTPAPLKRKRARTDSV